ncbi:MAG TPA: hypothetical protein VMJ30_01955 [Gemmatimonadales bacterium]|nr:hypothetical protein [Gemmatimonadales bacterium]
MSASATASPASAATYGAAFWEGLWRGNGLNTAIFLVVAFFVYGNPPGIHASADELVAFYAAHHTRILIAAVVYGLGILNLAWFAAAVTSTLRAAGQAGWGAAETAASSAVACLLLLLVALGAASAYAIAGAGDAALTVALHQVGWAIFVLSSFPRAMLIMAASFGLWRAEIISNRMFGAGVTAVVMGVLSGTTWMADGIWAPDGAYSRLVFPIVSLVWLVVFGGIIKSAPATRGEW